MITANQFDNIYRLLKEYRNLIAFSQYLDRALEGKTSKLSRRIEGQIADAENELEENGFDVSSLYDLNN